MGINYADMMYRINCLAADLDALYHQAALKLGMPDSVMLILYLVYEKGGTCPLRMICQEASLNKQTLNSAIRKLEREEIIYLEQSGGRAKNVCLTQKGREYAEQTIAKLFAAERSAFHGWTEDEIHSYLELMEKYNNDFREQIKQM